MPGKAADKIEIHVDACWLTSAPNNPNAAGGWGAVIVNYKGQNPTIETLSGPVGDYVFTPDQAETYGAYTALKAVLDKYDLKDPHTQLPQITLKTDSESLVNALKRTGKNLYARASQYEQAYGKEFEELASLIRGAEVTVQRTPGAHAKPRHLLLNAKDYDAKAHALANHAAWKKRLEMQGYVSDPSGRRLTDDAAINAIQTNTLVSGDFSKGGRKQR